jgi:hypothetical protein
MDTSIRVLVANRPRLLRELVTSTLSEQEGISVVGETDNERDAPSLVAETKPDFRSPCRACLRKIIGPRSRAPAVLRQYLSCAPPVGLADDEFAG